jgi:hypothetical protein
LTRRCPSSPNSGSPEPTTRQTGSLQHRLRRDYCRRRPRRREDLKPPPPGQAYPDPPLPDLVVVKGAKEIRRSPGSGKSRAWRPASEEHRRRRGTTPTTKPAPAAPPPPSCRRPETHRHLTYVHTERRASPTLPPPKRPAEREEPTPQRRRGWDDGRLSKSRLSGYCRGERGRGRHSVLRPNTSDLPQSSIHATLEFRFKTRGLVDCSFCLCHLKSSALRLRPVELETCQVLKQ